MNDKSDKKVDHSNEKKNEANENRPKDLRETIENKKATKVSGSQSNPDFKSTSRKRDRYWIFMIYVHMFSFWLIYYYSHSSLLTNMSLRLHLNNFVITFLLLLPQLQRSFTDQIHGITKYGIHSLMQIALAINKDHILLQID